MKSIAPAVGLWFEAPADSDVAALEVGESLRFCPTRFTWDGRHGDAAINVKDLEGVLLAIHLIASGVHRIEGSAVMVAPGIALCASHVVMPHVDALEEGATMAVCSTETSDQRQAWRVTRISPVPQSDVCVLSLRLVRGLPADRTFFQASVTTRHPLRTV